MAGEVQKTITEAYAKLVKRFTRSAEKGTEDPTGPNQDAVDFANRQLEEGAEESAKSFHNAAQEEAQKHGGKGLEISRIERRFIDWMSRLFDAAEKLRKKITKSRKPAKVALAIVAAAAVASVAAWVPRPAPQRDPLPPPPNIVVVDDDDIPQPLPDISPLPGDLTLSGDEFDALVSRLEISPLSLEALGRERLDLDVSDLPEPVNLPVAIAAASAAPVEVSVRQGDVSRSGTTTVQQLYETMPDAHDQIEDAVRESGGSGLHVDIDVGTDFANIRIRS